MEIGIRSFSNATPSLHSRSLLPRRPAIRPSISQRRRRRYATRLKRTLIRAEHTRNTVQTRLQPPHAVVSRDGITSEDPTALQEDTYRPDALRLPPGQLTPINALSTPLPEDQYQEPADGSRSWRLEDNGYLLKILDSHVYDVALRTPLEVAEKLSTEFNNRILLKREDLQPVRFL